MMTFKSYVGIGAEMPEFSETEIKNEPMLFNCSTLFALEHGGPITRAWLERLDPQTFLHHGIVDTRVHMLMKGWYPCIPGWHHDDVPRSTADGQPNYKNPEYFSYHCAALVNAKIAPTEFLIGDIDVPDPEPGRVIYEQWDRHLRLGKSQGKRVSAPDRRLLYFDAATFHRGVEATENGWRWFGRISINTDRKPTNEIRRQVQVYLSVVNAGW